MKYISTRGEAPKLNFLQVILTGLAEDGGLYMPEEIPSFTEEEILSWKNLSYEELFLRVTKNFIDDEIPSDILHKIIKDSYREFPHPNIVPLHKINEVEYVAELFHGPSLAFKDFALQFLGRLIQYCAEKEKHNFTVIGATSGDTGAAAIAGCKNNKNLKIFILYPDGKISPMQQKIMTATGDDNVFCLAVNGDFDLCQSAVKNLFVNKDFQQEYRPLAVNSINFGRILAQIVYYFWIYFRLLERENFSSCNFVVPTGNFGNILAGYIAKKMGLNISKLIIASNRNDILYRCIKTGFYKISETHETISPSMDIQISSNFERMLFMLYEGKSEIVKQKMLQLKNDGEFNIDEKELLKLQRDFSGERADDNDTIETIKNIYKENNLIIDPHSAVGVHVARKFIQKNLADKNKLEKIIILSTAHPAKFPEVIEGDCNIKIPQTKQLQKWGNHPEKYITVKIPDGRNRHEKLANLTEKISEIIAEKT